MDNIARLHTVTSVSPVPGADRVDIAQCDNDIQSVVTRGTISVGDDVVFFPPGVVLPVGKQVFSDCKQFGSTVINHEGFPIDGHVVSRMKIQGCESEGVMKKASLFPGLRTNLPDEQVDLFFSREGVFRRIKEPPVTDTGEKIGVFPGSLIAKPRWKNIRSVDEKFFTSDPDGWIPIERMGGMSATFWFHDGKVHAASKNKEVRWDNPQEPNVFTEMIKRYKLDTLMSEGQVIQGEIYGEGIRSNLLGITGRKLSVHVSVGLEEDTPIFMVVNALKASVVPNVHSPRSIEEARKSVARRESFTHPGSIMVSLAWIPATDEYSQMINRSIGVSVVP